MVKFSLPAHLWDLGIPTVDQAVRIEYDTTVFVLNNPLEYYDSRPILHNKGRDIKLMHGLTTYCLLYYLCSDQYFRYE